MLHSWNSVIDDRGVRHRVLDMYHATAPHGLRPKDVAREGDSQTLVQSIFWNTLPMAVMLYVLVVGSSLRIGGVSVISTLVFGLLLIPFSLVFFGVPMAVWLRKVSWRSPMHGRNALVAADICPHCAHGIGGIPPEPDGCTVCPECGAAWRVAQP